MTRCYLAFGYTELSKFVQCPGSNNLKAAERVLQYLHCTYELWLTFGLADPSLTHILREWVD
eukprot:2929541-Rhodomonas_salina.2